MDADLRKLVKDEVKAQLNILLNAAAGGSQGAETETISTLFPGAPDVTNRPVMHPSGFASRAVAGTLSVVGKVGNDGTNRMTLGHRDYRRRDLGLAEGDVAVYHQVGNLRLQITGNEILVGRGGDFEPVPVGETLRQLLISLIETIVAHTHMDSLGGKTQPPFNAADFTALQASSLDNKRILAQDGGRF